MSDLIKIYTQCMGAIDLISQAWTETAACDECRISVRAFRKYTEENVELRELRDEAVVRGYDRMADILLDPFANPLYGESDVKRAKLVTDNMKWLLARRRPDQYSERVKIEHTVTADRAIIEALERGRERVSSMVLDAVMRDITPPRLPAPTPGNVISVDVLDDELLQFV